MNAPESHPTSPADESAREHEPPASEAPTDQVSGARDATVPEPAPMLLLGGIGAAPQAGGRTVADRADQGGRPCAECGGTYDADGYCAQCGAKEADPRDHVELAPASWVAGVSDRGVRHPTNEDALAVDADEEAPRRAALVVCDGVSTARMSAEASAAAAGAALAVLRSAHSRGVGGVASAVVGALGRRLDTAADAALDAVRGMTERAGEDDVVEHPDYSSNPACTFVAAAVDDDTAVVGSVGDSRAYWVPDSGPARLLTTDDSWAEEQIRLGVHREDAEAGPQAHTITRWLGVDAPDHVPAKAALSLGEPGWLVLCSDGLWNYCSAADRFAAVLVEVAASVGDAPVQLARGLTDWANARGGRDNITVALARVAPSSEDERRLERGSDRTVAPTDAAPATTGATSTIVSEEDTRG